ncbi:hypothetical protein STEG23_003417, partial [Scotinomys teguina]
DQKRVSVRSAKTGVTASYVSCRVETRVLTMLKAVLKKSREGGKGTKKETVFCPLTFTLFLGYPPPLGCATLRVEPSLSFTEKLYCDGPALTPGLSGPSDTFTSSPVEPRMASNPQSCLSASYGMAAMYHHTQIPPPLLWYTKLQSHIRHFSLSLDKNGHSSTVCFKLSVMNVIKETFVLHFPPN